MEFSLVLSSEGACGGGGGDGDHVDVGGWIDVIELDEGLPLVGLELAEEQLLSPVASLSPPRRPVPPAAVVAPQCRL